MSQKTFEQLRRQYEQKKHLIQARLHDFAALWEKKDNNLLFEELCYCILTANASAEMGERAIQAIRPYFLNDDPATLAKRLKESSYRFPNKRAEYICATREYLQEHYNFDLVNLIAKFNDPQERRDFFAKNKNIKGIGYKEASHFLRNIGFRGYAILDKHILKTLCEFDIICAIPKTLTRKRYLELEIKLKNFAKEINIDFDELDLLLWSEKTGKILK